MQPRTTVHILWIFALLYGAALPAFAQRPSALPAPAPAQAAPQPPALPAAATSTGAASASPDSKADGKVTVQAKLSTATPTFGDTLQLQVTLTYPSSLRVFFPAKPNLRPFIADPNDLGTSERREQNGMVTESYKIPMLAVRSGLLRTPVLEVPYHAINDNGGAGESGSVSVPSLKAVVRSQFASETEVKPAPLPKPTPLIEENTPLEIGLFVAAMMALSGGLTLLGLRIYKDRVASRQPKQTVSPHILALGRLEEMLRSGRLLQGQPKLIIGELTEILREYLGGRYRFHALDMTGTELMAQLAHHDLRTMQLIEFQSFVDTTDLVKFAGIAASEDDLQQLHGFVRKTVELTMQTPDELARLRQAEIARLALQRRLRIQVMAPLPLRVQALAIDVFIGSLATAILATVAQQTNAINGQKSWLIWVAFAILPLWLGLRDALSGNSPGKALVGLEIAEFESDTLADAQPWRRETSLSDELTAEGQSARMASWSARLQRNLLLMIPVGGAVAETLTCLNLPEQRRFGDQWANTRVIDGKYGLRKGKPSWNLAVLLLMLSIFVLVWPLATAPVVSATPAAEGQAPTEKAASTGTASPAAPAAVPGAPAPAGSPPPAGGGATP